MSLTFTTRRNLYGKLTRDSSTDNLSFGDDLMNQEEKRIVNSRAWDFTQKEKTTTTVASQQFYNLPVNYRKLIGKPYITVGTTKYIPLEAPDRQTWDFLNSTSNTSDIPQFFFLFDRQIGFYPKPSTVSNTITLPIEIQPIDMSIADFTTGSVVTATNASTAIVGTGTSWTSGMAGKYLKIDDDNTSDSGDNQWYEIASVTDATNIVLTLPYEGTAVTSATQGYTIGQMSILPDGYDMLPIYRASQQYFVQNDNATKADEFKKLYDDMFKTLVADHGTKSSDLVVDDGNRSIHNPNLFLRL